MTLSRGTKITLGSGLLVAVLTYLVIVDLGLSAGKIHYGVQIRGAQGDHLNVGGLTPAEADELLAERAEEMLYEPIVLGGPGISYRFYPRKPDFGEDLRAAAWAPGRPATIEAALAVGREDAPFGALADRWKAWFGGVKVNWQGHAQPYRVDRILDDIEQAGDEEGLVLERTALRLKIRRVLNTWPRKPVYRIPFEETT